MVRHEQFSSKLQTLGFPCAMAVTYDLLVPCLHRSHALIPTPAQVMLPSEHTSVTMSCTTSFACSSTRCGSGVAWYRRFCCFGLLNMNGSPTRIPAYMNSRLAAHRPSACGLCDCDWLFAPNIRLEPSSLFPLLYPSGRVDAVYQGAPRAPSCLSTTVCAPSHLFGCCFSSCSLPV